MNIQRAFQIFDLDPQSPPETIQKRYHDLAAVWHPDVHANNPRLHALASEKMKEINAAYKAIRLYLDNHLIIACKFCGTNNRKRIDLNIDYATCSVCGRQLKKPLPRKQRTPCGNTRCAGTIGSNGRCNYCGETLENGKKVNSANATNQQDINKKTRTSKNSSNSNIGIRALFGIAAAALILLIPYAHNEDKSHKTETETANTGSAAGKNSHPEPAEDQIVRRPPVLFRSDLKALASDDSYYSGLLRRHAIQHEDVFKLQEVFRTLGYRIKTPDGLICNKTIACLKQYSTDFGYTPTESFPHCFFKDSFLHYQIAAVHKDWLDIYLTNDLRNWIEAQPHDYRRQIYALPLDNPQTAVQLVRRYKFEKFRPLPAYLPETGIIRKNFESGSVDLKIRTQTETNNYYLKLVNHINDQETLAAFIRSGSTLSVHIPFGVYVLKYASGHNWYGLEYLFGTSASYAKLPALIHLTEMDNPSRGINIDLIPRQHGTLTTEILSEFDF